MYRAVLAALVVGFVVVVAIRADHSVVGSQTASAGAAPQDEVDARGVAVAGAADDAQLRLGRLDRIRQYAIIRGARHHAAPYIVPAWAAAGDALVLPPRAAPYDLGQVAQDVPEAFGRTARGALLLRTILVVAPGATLVVDSNSVPRLALRSDADGYAYLGGVRAQLEFRGHPGNPLRVASYDSRTGRYDADYTDHRAYVSLRGGTLITDHARFEHLGFPSTGATSGVAWAGSVTQPTTGTITDSVFRHNYFGVYTANTHDLRVDRAKFLDNAVYGFDPHTATTHTLVQHSVASRNGRHGIIFSDACSFNVVRSTTSSGNRGDGFVVDDGTPIHGHNRPSNHNTLVDVTARGNGVTGIAVQGGVGNAVLRSTVADNPSGIRVRDHARGVRLVDNRVVGETNTGPWGPASFLHWSVLGVWLVILAVPAVALLLTRRRRTVPTPPRPSSGPPPSTGGTASATANLIGPPRGGAVW